MSFIHDNTIQSYNVDFEAEMLTIKTLYHTDKIIEKTDVVFMGYLAHSFDHEMKNSIIFDIEEYPFNLFFEENSLFLQERKDYGWPILYPTENELIKFFKTHDYKIFEVCSSLGLSGWIFAKQMEIIIKSTEGVSNVPLIQLTN